MIETSGGALPMIWILSYVCFFLIRFIFSVAPGVTHSKTEILRPSIWLFMCGTLYSLNSEWIPKRVSAEQRKVENTSSFKKPCPPLLFLGHFMSIRRGKKGCHLTHIPLNTAWKEAESKVWQNKKVPFRKKKRGPDMFWVSSGLGKKERKVALSGAGLGRS